MRFLKPNSDVVALSREHLPKYADEFAFRWTHRNSTDSERTVAAIQTIEGKRLTYQQVI